ncbi:MAG: cryptochrome/photolyase family protein, partial [Calditrichaeota bacterium]|nr:cryptochrome/photolyase family protein [Calditrichota bacterium]
GSPYLYHSRLSFAMNLKLLHPREIVQKTLDYWQAHPEAVDIAQVEGFIRQIIGWREFMRGIYWDTMPEYEQLNYFDHRRPLPAFYWTGDTRMNCLRHAITQSLDLAYAHHIQRLMITGNFANLLGVHPDAVDAWYLGIYIDAIQWV